MINVSIVTFFTPDEMLTNCIESLKKCNNVVSIFVIDNSSEQFSKNIASDLSCEYIWNPSNPGYGAAHNIGFSKSLEAGIEFHAVVNADTYFYDNVFSVLLEEFNNDSSLGLCAPDIIDQNGKRQFLSKMIPTPIDFLIRLIGFSQLKKMHSKKFQLLRFKDNESIYAPYQSGCFMLFRVSTLCDVGFFDERFFMYPEDIDISRRIAVNWKTKSTSKCSVIHLHNAESKRSVRMLIIHVFNMIKYFNKWGWLFDAERAKLNKVAYELNIEEEK